MSEPINMRVFEGQTVAGHYRLVQYLDEGGFGAVYRASHVAFELELREVAIKLAKYPMDDREAREIFGDALIMAKIAENAPEATLRQNFITVHDAGRCPAGEPLAGHPYMVMELIRGGSLRNCLALGTFPLKRAILYFDQMLAAVAFMHEGVEVADGSRRPLVHRDIKPGNFLVVRNPHGPDTIKVTDFGLAVDVDTLLGWIDSGGDLGYLAPESFSHNICSPQSDVYMLALVFYEMLTGHGPFRSVGSHMDGDSEQDRQKLRDLHLDARHEEGFSLLEQHKELTRCPQLREVIRNALTMDMNTRPYENAGEFLAAWNKAKAGEGDSPGEKSWETVRRLTGEAEQYFAVQDQSRGSDLLQEAMGLNRNPQVVPDHMVVGRTYLLMVKEMLKAGQVEQAGKLAAEGYHRRKCRSTCKAMASYYRKVSPNTTTASTFDQEAQTCGDWE